MFELVASSLLALVVVPLLTLYWFTRGGMSLVVWTVKALAIGGYIVATFYAGPWHVLSYYGRYALLGLLVLVVLRESWRLARWETVFAPQGWHWLEALFAVGVLFVVTLGLGAIYRSHDVPAEPVELSFPLRDGVYYVAAGGSHKLMNPHRKVSAPHLHKWRGQLWALDVVGLYSWGGRARGLYPENLNEYAIFGNPVYAPCDGRVAATETAFVDGIPPARDTTHRAGNYVLVECNEDAFVLLAHLQQGSIDVAVDDRITAGMRLAAVGNSGNSWEPHLHISAQQSVGYATVLDADPRPVTFGGDFLVRNDLIRDRSGN